MALSKKTRTIIIAVVVVILLMIIANYQQAKKEAEIAARNAAAQEQEADYEEVEIDEFTAEQAALTEAFGEAPEGFYWDDDGTLIAYSDNSVTAEDTAYYFLRGLSTLDFSTAQKYSSYSSVINTYDSFYDSDSSENYYVQFLRKMYKECLLSVEINEVKDSAVFADGTRIITFSLNVLDLTDKEFWEKDKEEIFTNLYNFYISESDGTKSSQYLYDYVLSYYSSEEAVKHTVTIDLRLEKQKDGGWLIIDDTDLNMICSYENGVNVTAYIQESYGDWIDDNEGVNVYAEDYVPESEETLTLDDLSTASDIDSSSVETNDELSNE